MSPGSRGCTGAYQSRNRNKIPICSDQVLLNGVAGGGTARGDLDLAVYRSEVRVDGARTDDELLGHLGVGQPLCYQPQHLHLSSCQSSRIDWRRDGCRRWLHYRD